MISDNLKTLGHLVTSIRKSKRQTQKEAAYESGVSERTYQRIESGQIVKTDGLLKVLAHFDVLQNVFTVLKLPKESPAQMATKKRVSSNSTLINKEKKVKIVWPEDDQL